MPTGYTYPVLEGATFEQFVWECARAFLFECRESDATIATETPCDDKYERSRVDEALTEVQALAAMTDAQLREHLQKQRDEALVRHRLYVEATRLTNRAFDEMIERVVAWKPPTPKHEDLKAFMLDQLQISKSNDTWAPTSDPVTDEDAAKWRARVDVDLYNAEEELRRKRKRHADRNAWVAALNESVPQPPTRPK